jgi:uncharacterized repeat protein (TIGR03987 family)
MLIVAIFFIFLACILYSLGVWAEKIQGRLITWHAIVFWCGLAADTIGTGAMGMIAGSLFKFNFHGITGMTAIILMLFHAIWATLVLIQKNESMIVKFHKLSFIVWIIWLIPMLSGMIFGAGV